MTKEVLYNGQCPICSAEIEHYRAQAQAAGAQMRFTDLNDANLTEWGLDADTAARRLHVRGVDGAQVAGLAAFVALWQDLPRFRWLARVITLPVLRPLAEWGYEWVAAPVLFRMHKRRQAKQARNAG